MQLEMMMMIEEMGIALKEEDVTCLLIGEVMIEGDPQVHTIGIGLAQTMGMEQTQIPGLNQEEALTMTEMKAQSMRDTTADHPHHVKDPDLEKTQKGGSRVTD